MTKQERHQKIKQLLFKKTISNQHELLNALKTSGVKVTQATLSRDSVELGVVRMHSAEGYKLTLPMMSEPQGVRSLIGIEVMSVTANEAMIIIKTLVGRAHGVGAYLDSFASPDILGTLAGDDTILVIPKSIRHTSKVLKFVQEKISETHS